MKSRIAALVALALLGGLLPLSGNSFAQTAPLEAKRDTDPVVLTGSSFPEWATLGDVALEAPSVQGKRCFFYENGAPDSPLTPAEACTHNRYEDPDFQSSDYVPPANATPVDRILGYRWNGDEFVQIPFQIDEMFTRYLSNHTSGFAFYSETDQHMSYAFDREGFRWTESDPDNPCLARPDREVAPDPVRGLDTDDELVFMARDAADRAPASAPLPAGVEDSYEVVVGDPANTKVHGFVYLMKAASNGPRSEYDTDNGYVRYERDPDSDLFLFSQSNYDDYGDAPKGPVYNPETGTCGEPMDDPATDDPTPVVDLQRRPGDQATITTPRYRFRYEGRWLMTELQISQAEDGNWSYEDDVIDQWKARAFQQRPGGETPCCGYEEEVNNWGGSSILMGERSGPVRTIRETWGADSGTNVVRREIFYRDEIRMISFLRVHVIPPADGIYAQWDYNAGIMTRYYNPQNASGVAIDGKNDDIGNTHMYVSHDGLSIDPDGDGPQEPIGPGGQEECPHDACINNDIDIPDPVFSGINAGLNWEQISGPKGTLVTRTQIHKATPGSAHSVVAVPYYRDDACFDDGTGSNPGPHVDPRDLDGDEPNDSTYVAPDGTRQERKCWDSDTDPAPPPEGDPRYYQGSIGTHGVHILLITDSDNAGTTAPVTEIDSDQRVVVLPGMQANVGELYGRGAEKPLVPVAVPESRTRGGDPTPSPTETSPTPTASPSESQAPEKNATSLEFTEQSDSGGQYSDQATLEARLTDDSGAVEGAEIVFELAGADGTSTFSATTDTNGVARVTPTLDRQPGSYQLVARYDGSDSNLGSADQTSFAIDKEPTDLALEISGKNSRRTLVARLTDDDSGTGIAERTIEFFSDGKAIGSARTNSNGVATAEARAGQRDFEARFGGDSYYLASSAQQRG